MVLKTTGYLLKEELFLFSCHLLFSEQFAIVYMTYCKQRESCKHDALSYNVMVHFGFSFICSFTKDKIRQLDLIGRC